ncbi:uncharacterized protein ColSpa_07000 [Colletotrichum spaethianum]|uniref:Uncharacterized protein n=1 Tax=Colletotrichum spaethianum TaxID=700344 RepID=A0AA37P817_9PEZI|nr:uncharacterized protein ColSpa_07000 [Colletotrichum spaethianum]GKT46819.1 hypothetical protein ColSpa_07000 [Colletotrichum spaethianum]
MAPVLDSLAVSVWTRGWANRGLGGQDRPLPFPKRDLMLSLIGKLSRKVVATTPPWCRIISLYTAHIPGAKK